MPIERGSITLDVTSRRALVGGRVVALSRTECALLRVFLDNPRQVLRHRELFDAVWGYDFGGNPNVLQTYVSYLRRKLGPGFRTRLHTVRGVGYRFDG